MKIKPPTPTGRMIGYARVSREEQSEKMQVDALVAAGVDRKLIYMDSASGRTLKRRGVMSALKAAREGDVLVVWKLDRLSRSVGDMYDLIADFRTRGIHLYSLTEGFDITTPWGKAMAMMSSVWAELEVETMSMRTKAGQAAGMELGYFPGRRSLTTPEQKDQIIKLIANKPEKHTMREWRPIVAKQFGISVTTLAGIVKGGRRAVTKERRRLREQERRRKE